VLLALREDMKDAASASPASSRSLFEMLATAVDWVARWPGGDLAVEVEVEVVVAAEGAEVGVEVVAVVLALVVIRPGDVGVALRLNHPPPPAVGTLPFFPSAAGVGVDAAFVSWASSAAL